MAPLEPDAAGNTTSRPRAGRRSALTWLALGGGSLVLGMGVLAFFNLERSERHITETLASMKARGKQLTSEQCVDELLRWAPQCTAMKSLCEASVPRLMNACLQSRERASECRVFAADPDDAHFGYAQCQARGVTRKTKKACGNAYRAIARHCQSERGSVGRRGEYLENVETGSAGAG